MAGMWIGGEEVTTPEKSRVASPYDGAVVDEVPVAGAQHVDRALSLCVAGAKRLRKSSGYERFGWLRRASELLRERAGDFATTITLEEGKTLAEALAEVGRGVETLELSAEEAKRLAGRGVPLDGAPGWQGQLGFTVRVPCGVVAAISPFNFPLNLVCHKLGPAIAGGNAVVLKPASATPLTALKLTKLLYEAGVPFDALHCLTGPGGSLGDALCSDPRVRKITFTGSAAVGDHICRTAGLRKVTMELGSNSPILVLDDADIDRVVKAAVTTGYGNAGQVCISTQRVLAAKRIYSDLIDALKPAVEAVRTGDPLSADTKMGPMVHAREAERVHSWISEAVASGARVVTGGERSGAMFQPTLLADVRSEMKVVHDELFGPAMGVQSFESLDEAIAAANDSRYGLAAGIFTRDVNRALQFIREMDSGNLHVNWGPGWRADLMPYGGLKESGFGKEGPAYAILEMTEEKMVVIHP